MKLPDALYERARQTAEAAARSVEDVLTQSIALSLPPLEEDLPAELRTELAGLSLKSDEELLLLADTMMADEKQDRLEALAEAKKTRQLTESEQRELAHLMEEAQATMLRKAEVFRLLAHRGHAVLDPSSSASPA